MPSHPGVGLGIVRGMCKQFKGTVYLTARYNNNPAYMEHKLSNNHQNINIKTSLCS